MKRAASLVAALVLLAAGVPSFAQQAGTTQPAGGAQADTTSQYPKDVYYKVVPLMKVMTGSPGYMVQFFNSKAQVQTVYIPISWFNNGPTSKADIVFTLGPSIPYMAIFWADGKFDHVTLYVSSNDNDPTNGVLGEDKDLSSLFNVQEMPRNF
jgi:hypothetical protein